jgi:hypothetical protein
VSGVDEPRRTARLKNLEHLAAYPSQISSVDAAEAVIDWLEAEIAHDQAQIDEPVAPGHHLTAADIARAAVTVQVRRSTLARVMRQRAKLDGSPIAWIRVKRLQLDIKNRCVMCGAAFEPRRGARTCSQRCSEELGRRRRETGPTFRRSPVIAPRTKATRRKLEAAACPERERERHEILERATLLLLRGFSGRSARPVEPTVHAWRKRQIKHQRLMLRRLASLLLRERFPPVLVG